MTNPIPPYQITTPFGTRGSWAAGYHTGDDYSTHGEIGKIVRAAKSGTVISTGNAWGSSYGIHVVIEHRHGENIRMGYCHLSRVSVRPGQVVRRGQIIGRSGNTGNVSGSIGPHLGAHLHYEERRAPFGYWNHRKPVFNRQVVKGRHRK
jgi:murein DD-endopeptidase MepM/ murein hydrolase activator NlpD